MTFGIINENQEYNSLLIDEIFASANLLQKILDFNKFHNWLKEHHNLEEFVDIFEGYKILIYSIIMKILDNITNCEFPFLQEDYKFTRIKNYRDHPFYPFPEPEDLMDIPNTCNKIIFLKYQIHFTKEILKAKDYNSFNEKIDEVRDLLKIISNLFKNFTLTNYKAKKNFLLKLKTCEFINTNYDQMHSLGYPMDFKYYIQPNAFIISKYFELKHLTDYYRGMIFKGYLYTLQYCWYCIIGKKLFFTKKVKNMTDIIDEKLSRIIRNKNFDNKIIRDYWNKIENEYYVENYNQIIRPLYKKIEDYDDYIPSFKIVTNNEKKGYKYFSKVLESNIIKDPDYTRKNDDESIIMKLDSDFAWLPIEVNGFSGDASFYGARLFITFLKGFIANIESMMDNEKNINVMIIKHPVKRAFGKSIEYTYSFAFLPSYNRNYYRTGWILFHRCFDIFGDGKKEYIDEFFKELNLLKENEFIILEEIQIEYNKFMKYISNRCLSFQELRNFEDSLPRKPIVSALLEEEQKILAIIKTQQSRIFEDMVRKWLRENQNYQITDTGYFVIKGNKHDYFEIDIIVSLDETNISIFECKLDLKEHHFEVEDIINRIHEKAKILIKNDEKYLGKNYSNFIVIWNEISADRRELLESNNINVIDNFKNIISKLPNFRTEKQSIINYFDLKRLWDIEKAKD